MYKILLIEDDPDIRDSLKDIFEITGHNVYTASDGNKGINMAVEIKPDIILCDICMPILDGFQVKKILNEDRRASSIPFIYLTAIADIVNMREGMNLGADDYIVKPIDSFELLKIINNRLNRIKNIKSFTINEMPDRELTLEDKIPVNIGSELRFVEIKNIVAIDVNGNYSTIHTMEGKKHLLKKTIKSWETILPSKTFIRAHRRILINLNFVEKIEHWFNGTLVAKVKHFPEPIPCSKRYSQQIKKMLK